MAAYASLVSLMHLIHDIQHHPSPPISLDNQLLDPINKHITFFQNFLESYSPPLHKEDADPLEMRIASAAHEAEEAIESHIVHTIQKLLENNVGSRITRLISIYETPKEPINANHEKTKSINLCRDLLQNVIEEMDLLHNVIEEMDSIKKEVYADEERNTQLVVHASVSTKETMVGLDAVKQEIMEKLTGNELNLQVISIVGMGGIGKTFLAANIYATPYIKEHFYICAWATVSQQYNAREILCEVLSQAIKQLSEKRGEILSEVLSQATKKEKEQLSVMSEYVLESELHKILFGRRFLIVLDDMWSIDAWQKVQRFFPKNRHGSRVLVTTRLSGLSSQLNNASYYSHHMSFLDKASSWNLFLKTVFGGASCPGKLKKVGRKIVEKCKGLPLSISVVGGLLKKVDSTQTSWESILNDLSSLVNLDNDKHSLKLLKMSYNHLPVYLKPCFLYMGVFEEDSEIRVSTLVKLWVSEGFIKPSNGEALETTARGFLQDLIDRNLVLIHKLGSTGSVKYCKIHDSLRDLCMKEGHKDGFYHVIRKKRDPPQQGINIQRRVIVPWNTSNEKVHSELRSMKRARSIICESGTRVLPFRNMRLLRTLHEYHDESSYLKPLAFSHVNLRHLTIKATTMSSFLLPSVASHIWNLQTLKVYCVDEPTILFSDFWKMPRFRYVKFVHYSFHLPEPPCDGDDVVIMENLHTLKGVSDFKCCEGVVKRIPNIKKLSLKYSNDQGEYFAWNINRLSRLESLSVQCWNSYVHEKLTFPHSLKKLFLWMNYDFKWEDMLEKIGSLPLLEKLQLCSGCFGKGKWETEESQFPNLKYLGLESCRGLENWDAAEGESRILPRLEHLHLTGLSELEISCEPGIDTLKSIVVIECGEGVVNFAKDTVKQQVESHGQSCLHVVVELRAEDDMLSLAGSNFVVRYHDPDLR